MPTVAALPERIEPASVIYLVSRLRGVVGHGGHAHDLSAERFALRLSWICLPEPEGGGLWTLMLLHESRGRRARRSGDVTCSTIRTAFAVERIRSEGTRLVEAPVRRGD